MAIYWDVKVSEKGRVFLMDETELHLNQPVKMGQGFLILRKTKKAGLHLVRQSSGGRFTYHISIKPGREYRVGPGKGCRIVASEEERDPIKRVLRQMDIPISKLEVGKGDAPPEFFKIETEEIEHLNNLIGVYVFKVIVWSGCDPDQLADALAPIIYGKGADRHFVGALKSADAAKRWITCRYEIESSTNWVDQDVVVMARPENGEDGIEIMLPGDWSRREETAAIHRLVQKFGPEVLGKLPPMAMLYFDAIQDIDQAIKWVLFRYQVVGIRKGNQFHAQFARRYNPYGLSRLDSAYLGDQNGQSDTGLDYVLRKYRGQIIPRLYLEADSRETIVDEYRIYPQDMASRSYGDCETIKQTENGFVVNFYDDKDAPRDYYGKDEAVLLSEKNLERFKNNCCLLAEPVTVGPFKSVASDLKFGEAGNPWEIISSQSEGSPAIRAILCDGNPFFFSNKEHQILIPIRAGETKRLIFSMSHEWTYRHNYSVWGVSVTLTEDGVEITPVDPEVSYSWDDEGNIKRN